MKAFITKRIESLKNDKHIDDELRKSRLRELNILLKEQERLDVKKLWVRFNKSHNNDTHLGKLGKYQFFKAYEYITSHSLNDKVFSLDDMRNLWEAKDLRKDESYNGGEDFENVPMYDSFEDYIQSLQQTSWDVEVEMEGCSDCHLNEGYLSSPNCCRELKPKITNNSIKVLRVL